LGKLRGIKQIVRVRKAKKKQKNRLKNIIGFGTRTFDLLKGIFELNS
jgi:hypothetical protein